MNTPRFSDCPKCGLPVPADAPGGLCPRCLGTMNLATETALSGVDALAAQPPLTPGELAPHFPHLEILECLGRGGMGVVYKARQKSLNRVVALKLLAPERVTNAEFARRFTHEAQALAALNHPSIVTIYDFGQAGGFYFLLMEFVDGVNLRQAMNAGRFTPEQALAIVPPVCEALQYAHERGIVHRDIKPENLLLDKAGHAKIADFGIAKMFRGEREEAPRFLDHAAANSPADRTEPATSAATAGTPGYMAPEQKARQVTDHRADIYSLGVVLYEMLTGELPAEKLQPPSRKVQVDVRLDEIVLRALEIKPERRYQTADEMQTEVETLASSPVGTPPAPAASATPRILKTATSTFTTPERLATFAGQFLHYRENRGQLILDERHLTHLCDGKSTVIPLTAIRQLDIGHYPLLVNPAGLDYLSITYENGGRCHEVILAPMKGWFAFPTSFNAHIAEWHAAIRAAVRAVTGTVPPGALAEQKSGLRRSFAPILALAAVPALGGLLALVYLLASSSLGAIRVDCVPVGVSNNVVLVDVITENRRGNTELQAGFAGPKLSRETEQALSDAGPPPFVGMLLKPTPHDGNQVYQSQPAGRFTARLGFVLPDPVAAQEAYDSLSSIVPLPEERGRAFGGTLFEVRRAEGDSYHATLRVGPPFTSADADWVSVSGSVQQNESVVKLSWDLLAAGPSMAWLSWSNTPITVFQPDKRTDLYALSVQVELIKLASNRVQFVRRIGSAIRREELPGNFRELAEELVRTTTSSAKARRGARVELCQFQGKSFLAQVEDAGPVAAADDRLASSRPNLTVVVALALVILGVVLLIRWTRREGTARMAVFAIVGVFLFMLGLGLASLIGYQLLRRNPPPSANVATLGAIQVPTPPAAPPGTNSLPNVSADAHAKVSIGNDGTLSLDGRNLALEALTTEAMNQPGRAFEIRANATVRLATVVEVVEALKAAGVTDLSFQSAQVGDGRFRVANRTGKYDLGSGRDLYLCRPGERRQWFSVFWPATGAGPRSRWSIYPNVGGETRGRWAVVWEPGADVLWWIDDVDVGRMRLTNPGEVLVTREPRMSVFSAEFRLPDEVKAEFRRLGFTVGPDE